MRILYVCTGNTCRSVLAEYLTRALVPGIEVESAGIRLLVTENASKAIQTLDNEFNIDASQHMPRQIGEVAVDRFDLVIALDSKVPAHLRVPPEGLRLWNIDDPWGGNDYEYRTCAFQIRKRVIGLKNELRRTGLKISDDASQRRAIRLVGTLSARPSAYRVLRQSNRRRGHCRGRMGAEREP